MRIRRPLLRYFGGKWVISQWIISHFPSHSIYTEAYGGAASVLLRKQRSNAEIYNDLDDELVNLFKIARDRGAALIRALSLTPYSRREFDLSYRASRDRLEQARRTVVRSYMGFGSTMTRLTVGGRLMRTGFRRYSNKNRGSIPAHDWKTYTESLPSIIDRLQGVIIENRPALEILRIHDSPESLHYLDPTYLHKVRARNDGYRHEMTEEDHRNLAEVLNSLRGKIILSGYDSSLYSHLYSGWFVTRTKTHADGARDRIESLWMNFEAAAEQDLFGRAA